MLRKKQTPADLPGGEEREGLPMNDRHFPKVELHLHLDGSFLPETVWELGCAAGIAMPADSLEGYRAYLRATQHCGSVNEYLERFDLPLRVMQDAPALTRVTRELTELLGAQGMAYAEIRFAPQLHGQKGMTQRQAVEAVLEGRRQALAHCPGLEIGILLCMMCVGPETANWEANRETVELAPEYLSRGVVGVDLAGAEGIVPLKNFAPLFRRAAELGVPFTCHAGDSQGPDTVRHAMDFGAKRIGHGHRIYEDPALCRRAAAEGVTLEICPTSNIQCKTQPSYAAHPAKKLLDMGIGVCINTDNMTLAGVELADEYRHCLSEMGFTPADLVEMDRCAIRASFAPQEVKERILSALDERGIEEIARNEAFPGEGKTCGKERPL